MSLANQSQRSDAIAENVIYVRSTRAKVREKIARAIAAASGRNGDAHDASVAMQTRIGMTALAHIKDAFITKSRGGTDESGLNWPKLAKSTIAYSRRHPGVPPAKQRAAFRPSWMITEKQRTRWWYLYRIGLARSKGDKNKAAAYAWATSKREGAKTLLGVYGNTQVEILRDTGLLLNSLSPGVNPGSVENQVFDVRPGECIVGTNRKHAASHHYGIPGRLPQRKLWPDPDQWPMSWTDDISEQASEGLIDILTYLLRTS